ncbi:flagellar hook-basal body protein [Bacillus litorisediminis]|uniref:flagellar hook-basal body protein n=1 Tax=Bacillus litorisediminis TaxID=2922713 RepID=UPI001FADA181|nr:flagellar hook-basal body protein [Bacillus litorisediminis]
MFKGFYTAATGMLSQQRKTEMLTNNLANVDTPGYKADQASLRAFPEMLLSRIGSQELPVQNGFNVLTQNPIGSINTGVYMQEITPDFIQGALKDTGLSTDLALVNAVMPEVDGQAGSVFFNIEHSSGDTYYTRNGNFSVDPEGFLTTAQGYYVLNDAGERIQVNSSNFQVTEDGFLLVDGQVTSRLGISYAANPLLLMKDGNGLFRLEEGELPLAYGQAGVEFNVYQGSLERSNVDSAKAMTDLLASYRTFEANQKVLQAYDRSMDKAVNEIGKIG